MALSFSNIMGKGQFSEYVWGKKSLKVLIDQSISLLNYRMGYAMYEDGTLDYHTSTTEGSSALAFVIPLPKSIWSVRFAVLYQANN